MTPLQLLGYARRSQGATEGSIAHPQDAKKYIFNKKLCQISLFFSAQNLVREAYSDH